MKNIWAISALFMLALACSARAEIVERIVAVINNEIITLSELDETVSAVHSATLAAISDPGSRADKLRELRAELLEQMIDQRVLTQQYDKLQITATEQEIDAAIDSICRQNNIALEVLKSELIRQGMAYEEYRDQMRQHILQGKFVEQQITSRISVSEDEVKRLYIQQISEASTKEMVELTGILVLLPKGGSPGSIEAARKKAADVRKQLLLGESPDGIAQSYADGSVASLGKMGKFTPGELMDPLDKAVFALSAGQVSEPVETSQGLYVFKVISRGTHATKEAPSYEDVREQLLRRYYDEQVETQLRIFVRNARKDAHVEVLL